jgi:hypothetical protein
VDFAIAHHLLHDVTRTQSVSEVLRLASLLAQRGVSLAAASKKQHSFEFLAVTLFRRYTET